MSDSIVVRITLGSYDFANPSQKQTQVFVQIPEVARVSYMLPASTFHVVKDWPWPKVLVTAQEHYAQSWVVDPSSAVGRQAVMEWLRDDANRDEMQAAYELDQARRSPITRRLLEENGRVLSELDQRGRDLADTVSERDELRARVAELEAEREKLVRWHGEDGKTINRLVARVERRQAELIALRNDALSVRGSLAPADGPRAVPFELGETLAPAVDWLIARVAELEAPDFFQPGHAYTHQPGPDTIGGPRARFYCETVTTGQPIARGWGGRRYGDRWTSVQQARGLEDWQSGAWTDTTGGDR